MGADGRAGGRWIGWIRRAGGGVAVWVGLSAGVWGAVVLVPEFRMGGTWVQQAAGAAAVAAWCAVVLEVSLALVLAPLLWPRRRAARAGSAKFPNSAVDVDFTLARWLPMFGCFGAVAAVAVILVGFPVSLWLGALLGGEWLGLPVRLSGGVPTVVAALVAVTLATPRWAVPRLLSGSRSGALRGLLEHGASLAGLLAAVLLLDGVRLDAQTEWRWWLALVVLAKLLTLFPLTASWLWGTLVAAAVLNPVKLWVLGWVSTGMEPTFRVSGAGTFLAAGLLVTVVLVPVYVAATRERAREAAERAAQRAAEDAMRWPPPHPPIPPHF